MNEAFNLTPFAVTMLIGTVIPILVGIVTKEVASSGLKAVILLFLSAVQGVIVNATLGDGSAVFSSEAIVTAALGFVSAVATYYGFLKPTGVTPAVNDKTANFGLGGSDH